MIFRWRGVHSAATTGVLDQKLVKRVEYGGPDVRRTALGESDLVDESSAP